MIYVHVQDSTATVDEYKEFETRDEAIKYINEKSKYHWRIMTIIDGKKLRARPIEKIIHYELEEIPCIPRISQHDINTSEIEDPEPYDPRYMSDN